MAYGLQTFDASGTLIVNITDRLTRHVGDYYVSVGAGGSAFVYVTGMTNDGSWAYFGDANYLSVTISSGGLSVSNKNTSSTLGTTLSVFRV